MSFTKFTGRFQTSTSATAVFALVASLALVAFAGLAAPGAADAAVVNCTPDGGYTNCQRFTYSGGDQTFTVPAGVTSVLVKSWGAGGGGADTNYFNGESGGGGGGYANGTATVTPGAALRVVVGGGGLAGTNGSSTSPYGGGGTGGTVSTASVRSAGGSGGGLSGVFTGTTTPVIVSGAGGGASPGADNGNPFAGGGGGATGGQDGLPAQSGRGGSQTTGGAGATSAVTCSTAATAGGQFTGGNGGSTGTPTNPTEGGGGGGSGYFGGGGGKCQNGNSAGTAQNGSGGGGSSYVGAVTAASTTAGGNATYGTPGTGGAAALTTDSQYVAGVATGGGVVAGGGNGGNGLVVIQWVTAPKLSLTKTNPATLTAGTPADYTLTVSNSGTTTATTATVVDRLPANVAYTSATGAGWTCTASGTVAAGQTVTCTFSGSIATGASSSFTLTATPALSVGGTSVRNVAAVDPTGLANPVDPTTCTANGTPAGCAYPAAQTVGRSAITCTPGDLYVVDSTDHNIYLADPTSGTETLVGSIAAAAGVTTNALAVTNGSGLAYAASGTAATGAAMTIYRYDPSTNTTTTYTGPTLATTTSTSAVIAGAINPVNGVYYFGFVSTTGTATTLEVYGFDTTTNTAIPGRIARIALTVNTGSTVNGDLAFDRLGRLFLVATTGDATTTANPLLTVSGLLGSTGTDTAYTTKVLAYLSPNNVVFNGIAFDLPTGYLYVTGRDVGGTTSFLKKINPSSGAQVASYPLTAGSSIPIDAASCNYNNSVTGQASIVNRAAAGDQFTETISGGGLVVNPAGTTSGTTTGLQSSPAATAGPAVTVPGSTYTVTQTAAGTTNLANYTTTYSCTNLLTGALLTSGTGNTATFVFPTPATNDGIPAGCVFTNSAFALSLQKTNPATLIAGQPANYSLTVINSGPSAAPSATVVDRLPANVAYTSSAGAGWTCVVSGTVAAGQTVTCTFSGTIAAGASNTALSIRVTPAASTSGTTVQNKAAVGTDGGATAVDPATCTSTGTPLGCAVPAPQTIGSGITLGLTKSAPSPALVVGYPSTYTLTVTNTGVNPAAGATIREVLPPNTAYVSAGGATCTVTGGSTTAGQTLLCTIPTSTVIAATNGTATVTVVVRPLAAAASVVNRASVDPTGGTNPVDPATCTATGTPAGCALSPATAAVADVVHGPSPSVTTTVGTPVSSIDVKTATTSSQGKTIVNPTIATQPANGTATVNADGTLKYTPNTGFSGQDTFTYTICDDGNPAACDTETVTITVNNVFTPGPAITTPQNTSVTTPLSGIATTTGKPLDPTRVTQVTAPAHGALSISATTGAVTYTPTAGYTGPDTYQVQVCDTSTPIQCTTITKQVTVGANTVTAVNDTATTQPATAVSINVRGNDTSQTGQPLANPTVTSAPTRGTAVVNPDGSITYSPTNGKTGTDTFVYRVCDTSTPTPVCSSATVTVTVPNTVTIVADAASTPQNTSVSVPLLANDTVSNGGSPLAPSTVTVTTAPTHGTVSINTTTGAATYVPTTGYTGTDSFVYRVCDTSSPTPVCGSATVTLTVGANTVTAVNDSATTTPGVPVTTDVRANDTTATGQPLGIPTVTTQPTKGTTSVDATTGRITYTPTNGTSGTDSYVYRVCDTSTPTPVCANATVTVNVTNTVTAVDDSATTPQNTSVTTTVLGNDTVSSNGAPLNPASVTVTTAPAHGSTSVNTTTGAVTYTPTNGYTGPDTYRYRVCDTSTPTPVCATANVNVTVGANTVTATNDSAATTPNTPVTTDVRANDTTSTGQPLANPTVTTAPTKGTTTVNGNGTITYTPTSGTSGVDTYTYRVCDTSNPTPVCATATVTVTVTNTVTAVNDVDSTPQNTPKSTAVLANDTVSAGGAPLAPSSVTVVGAPTHGTTSVNTTTGAITFTPTTGYTGNDVYTYRVCDTSTPTPTCATATTTITIGANTVTAVNDTASTTPGVAVTTDVRANDTTATGQPLANPTVPTQPAKGTAVVNANGTITYTPTNGTSGTDTYTYRVCDTSTPTPVCSQATVTVTVTNTVTANPDSATTPQNTSVAMNVLANDTVTAGGAPLSPGTVAVTTAPAHGSTSINTTTGVITYTPTAGYTGTDTYRYQVCDTSTPTPVCATALATVTIGANTVTAVNDSATTTPGTGIGIDVRANDTSSTGQPLANPTVTTAPTKGTTTVTAASGRIIYTPRAGTSGVDTFVYQVCDTSTPTPVCASATVTVTVTNVVTANDDASSTPQNTPVTTPVLSNDTVSNNGAPLNPASVTVTTAPLHGTTSVNTTTGAVTFTPTTGYTGTDTYRYQVCDGSTPTPVCATATVTITVGGNVVTATNDTASTTPTVPVTTDVRANDTTSTGQPLANPTVIAQGTKGTAAVNTDGTITYTPASGQSGVDTYRYQVCDTSSPTPFCATASVTVTIRSTVTANRDTLTVAQNTVTQNTSGTSDVTANDTVTTGGAPLDKTSVTIVSPVSHGTTSINPTTGAITYTPTTGYSGGDVLTYQVCDTSTPTPNCGRNTLTITVTPNVVTAVDDTASTTPGTPVTTTVRANDTTATGQPLANPTIATAPSKGTATVNTDGTITYIPRSGTSGIDTYRYQVCDTSTPTPACATATVTVTVTNTVTAVDDAATTPQNTSVTTAVLGNDTVSPNGSPLNPASVAVTTAAAHGTTSVNTTTGAITFTPTTGYSGPDSYRYQVCDGSTPTPVCSTATVNVTVGANVVTAVNDTATTGPTTPVTIDVRANDTTTSGQPLANPTVLVAPGKGTASVNANGTITYTPNRGTSGTDTFTYQVCDTSSTPVCASATVTVTVPNTVTAVNDSATTPQNTAVTTTVLANDTVTSGASPLNPASVTVTSAPAHGSTTVNTTTGAITFTPTAGYTGMDSYSYQVCDGSTPTPVCATATVTVTVGGNTVVANPDTATTQPITAVAINVRANDSSSTGQPLAIPTVTGAAAHGSTSVDGTTGVITYTPASGFSGQDTFVYRVCDTSTPTPVCSSATVTVTVPDTVTATNDIANTPQNTSVTTSVLGNDTVTTGAAPLNPGSVTITSAPAHGTTSVNTTTGAVTYVPTTGYSGPDSYRYQVCDTSTPTPVCAAANVNVTVGANTVTAGNDAATTPPATPVTTNVRANDTSTTGQPLANPTVTTQPTKGTAVVNGNGTITYTPTSGTSGTDSYAYRVCDTSTPTPVCATATVTVTVTNTVTAVADSAATAQNTPVTTDVLSNDTVSSGGAPLNPGSVTITTPAAHGTTSVNTTTGAVTYTPTTGYSGTDTYSYQVCDTSSPTPVCSIATVSLSVGGNTVRATNDTDNTTPGVAVTTNVRANDSSATGQPLTNPTVTAQGTKGTAAVNRDGTITYTPNAGTSGTDIYSYQVCDTSSPTPVCATATVTITVANTVTATNDTVTTPQNKAVTTLVLANDSVAPKGAPLDPSSVTVTTAPTHGMTTVNSTNGAVTYTPLTGYSGTDSYTYRVCDTSTPTPVCATALVSVTVGANTVTAVNDIARTTPNNPVTTNVRGNDTTTSGQPLANPTVVTQPSKGTAVLETDGTITYTPTAGTSGTDTYTYRVCDTSTPTPVCANATVTVSVTNAVTANPDTASTAQNTAVSTPVLANDSISPGGAPLDPASVTITTAPAHGSTAVNTGTGAVTFTPEPGYSGPDTYTYRVCDTSTPTPVCASSTVSITVGGNTVSANNDTYATTPGTAVTFDPRTNDSSASGQPLSAPTLLTQPTKGSAVVNPNGTVTYTPTNGTSGADSFTYRVCDTSATPVCGNATITVNVNNTVTAQSDSSTAPQNGSVSTPVLANDTISPNGAPLDPASVTIFIAPTHGTTSINTTTGAITYTPTPGYSGPDTYRYSVCDTSTPTPVCDRTAVSITVSPNTVTAVGDTLSTQAGVPLTVDVRANDTSSSGQPLGPPTIVVQPTQGTVVVNPDGTITYTPQAGKSGSDSFTYQVCDTGTPQACSQTTATASITVVNTVTAVNDTATTAQNTAVVTPVLQNDTVSPGGSPLNPASVMVTVAPQHGTTSVNLSTGAITYTPANGYSGSDSYSYRVCDGSSPTPVCGTAVVSVTVGGNTVVANNDSATTTPGNPVSTDVRANDSSSTGQPLANPTIVTPPTKGTVVVNAAGTITYTPTDGTSGTDSYVYQVCDTSSTPVCGQATVTVSVVNTVTARNDTASIPQNGTASIPVLANDSATPRGSALNPASVAVTTAASSGTTSVNTTTGVVTYVPNPGFSGNDTFTYQVCDSSTPTPVCGSATVTVLVGANSVTANADTATTTPGNPVTTDVRANDSSGSGQPLANPTVATAPTKGTAVVNTNGTITYTPRPGTSGTDTYTYQVCDTGTPATCSTATVTVSVNNTVTAIDDAATTPQNTSTTTNVLANDTISPNGAPLDPASVTVTTAPLHGTATPNPDGTITYAPQAGYSGTDSYGYRVCDTSTPTPVCDVAIVSLSVGTNTVTAVADSAATTPGTSVTTNVRANDSSGSGQPLANPTVAIPPSKGTATVNPDGTITYVPTAGTSGTDTYTYQVCDTGATPVCATATVTVAVTNTVTAQPDTASVAQNGSVSTPVLSNDTVSPGGAPLDPTSVRVTTASAHGTTSVSSTTGAITYTPTAGYSGPDGYSYQVCDGSTPTPVCSTTTVSVTVRADVLTVRPDAVSTAPGNAVTTDVRANDSTSSGQPLAQPTIGTAPTKGTAVVNADGTITYTPRPGTSGTDTYTYQVCDTGTPAVCGTGTVTVSVPSTVTANPDAATTAQNTAVTTPVTANDTISAGGSPLNPASVTITVAPTHGTAAANPDGSVTYTPAAGYSGTDTYTYRVCDSSTPTPSCSSAAVTVSVGSNSVVAGNDSASTTPGNPVIVNVRANDSSSSGQPLGTPTVTTAPTKGTATVNPDGTITYTPTNGTSGTDPFTYRVCDTGTPPVCGTATVTVAVTNQVTANPDPTTVTQNGFVTTPVLANDTVSANGAPLNPASVAVTGNPAHGTTVVNADGTITYTPAAGYSGRDSYTYQVCDRSTPTPVCGTGTVSVTVNGGVVTAGPDTASTTPGNPVTTNVRANDSSSSGQPLANPTIVTAPTKGTAVVNADGSITYTPTPGTSGTDSYTYQVCDTGVPAVCGTATVTVSVANTVTATPDNASTPQNTAVTTPVLGNDTVSPGGAPLNPASVTVTVAPAHGTTSVNAGTGAVTYTPALGYSGPDSYTYRVCDGSTPTPVCATAVVRVAVGTDTVSANPDAASTTPGNPVTTAVRANDSTSTGQPLANPTIQAGPAKGTATVNPDGTITYTPADGTSGTDSYAYRVCDTSSPTPVCGITTVTISVVNTVTANDDRASAAYNTPVVTSVLANDTVSAHGAPLDPASVKVTTGPTNGTTAVNTTTGAITYTPNVGFSGTDSYTYTVCDGSTPTPVCDNATVTVTVAGNVVRAVDDTASTTPGTAVTTNVEANDTSAVPLANPTIVTAPTKGTVVVNGDGTITYTPRAGTSGTDSYTYQVCDTSTPTPSCSTATVTVSVTNVVTTTNDTASTASGTPVTTAVLANDTVSTNGAPLAPSSVTVVTAPAHGRTTVDPATGDITYTPDAGYAGTDTYTYRACDTSTPTPVCATATVTVTVAAAPTVTVGNDTATTKPATPVTITVLGNDSSNTGRPLGLPTVVTGPTKGTVVVNGDGTITYTPRAGTSGTDTFTYQVCDTSPTPICGTGTVTVSVPNTVTARGGAVTIVENGTVVTPVIPTAGVTPGGAPLDPTSVVVVVAPQHGTTTVDAANGAITYTADPGYVGPDSYTYRICDTSTPEPVCTTAVVSLTVTAPSTPGSPAPVQTVPGTPAGSGPLPKTGSPISSTLAIALVILALGALLITGGRRRPRRASTLGQSGDLSPRTEEEN